MAVRIVFFLAAARALAVPVDDENCDAESSAAAVVMLQQQVSMQAAAATLRVRQPLVGEQLPVPTPVRFAHIPKTGMSFFNAIYALPGVCVAEGVEPPSLHVRGSGLGDNFMAVYESCPGFVHEILSHGCVQPLLPEASGHFMAMFRQPEQRLISLHNYAVEQSIPTSPIYNPSNPWSNPLPDIRDYFEHSRGGMVYQLTHNDPYSAEEWFCTGNLPGQLAVTDADVDEAVRVISEDFAFVGITEQWDLSICLLHAMFGGACTAPEFDDIHPGLDPETGLPRARREYDVSVLEGAIDTQDRVLYDAALGIFERNLEAFGVTAESCEQGCWATARR